MIAKKNNYSEKQLLLYVKSILITYFNNFSLIIWELLKILIFMIQIGGVKWDRMWDGGWRILEYTILFYLNLFFWELKIKDLILNFLNLIEL